MYVLTHKPQTTMGFDLGDAMMGFLRFGMPPILGAYITHRLIAKRQAKESAKGEIVELRKELDEYKKENTKYQEDNRGELFEIRLAINDLCNRIGDTVIYPKNFGRKGYKNGLQ